MKTVLLNSLLSILFVCTQALASSSEPKEEDVDTSSQELSLKQDRAELDELRKEVPEDIKQSNDDMAFILKLFENKARKPSKIRSQFTKVYNRTRKKKQKEFKKERNQFTKAEKKRRKAFQKQAKKKRQEFLDSDPEKDDKKEYFAEERVRQKEFYNDERDKRKEFEADLRARRKEFDDYLKDRRKDFDDRLRQFRKEQKEMKRMQRKMKKQRSSRATSTEISPENQKYLSDFDKIPRKGGHRLAPPDEK